MGKRVIPNWFWKDETYVSTVYMNGVCIPHPLETDAIQNMISGSYYAKTIFS